jgi:DNA-binding NarL/FixJ family response regulator
MLIWISDFAGLRIAESVRLLNSIVLMGQDRIRVICVDDHPVVQAGLVAILSAQSEIEVVATASSAEQGIELVRQHRPDVTLMDLKLTGMGGAEAVEVIRREFPKAKLIVLTTFEGEEDIYRALQAGAATYLLKDSIADELVRAVKEVHSGGRPIPKEIAARLAERITQPSLTPREVSVLRLVAKGHRNKEIAGDLGISEETVQVHVKSILLKLGVHDRTAAVTTALRRGILRL